MAGVVDVEALTNRGATAFAARPHPATRLVRKGRLSRGRTAFFPALWDTPERAQALCDTCPVAGPCLEYALADPHVAGWWAGTSQRQRRRLRRQVS